MEEHKINLTGQQIASLNNKYPITPGNKNTELRAEEIVKIYLSLKYSGCTFEQGTNGADLKVITTTDSFEIEVKGTKQENIAWTSLKINGNPSYRRLKADMPMYRVTGVFKDQPSVLILKYSQDFEMIQEDRWRVRAKKS